MPLGDTDESSKISRVDAQGHVLVSTQTDVGRGDYGVYNADSGIATLLGNVTVTRGPNTIRGEYAVMDLNNNVSRMMAGSGDAGRSADAGRRAVRPAGSSGPGPARPVAGHPAATRQKP